MNKTIYTRIRLWLHQIRRWKYLGLCLIMVFTLGLHFGTIMHPSSLLFDENYYVPDARSIITHEGTLIPEHPPLGKLFIVAGFRPRATGYFLSTATESNQRVPPSVTLIAFPAGHSLNSPHPVRLRQHLVRIRRETLRH